jgi:ParB family chromosome partitioning protein
MPPTAAGADKTNPAEKSDKAHGPTLAHDKRRALGRGLDSLLPTPRVIGGAGAAPSGAGGTTAASVPATMPTDGHAAVPGVIQDLHAATPTRKTVDGQEIIDIPLDRVAANPHQTRTILQKDMPELEELAASIRLHGVMQPVSVRPGKDGHYVLIAGERRVRASKLAEKATVPAMVRLVSEQQAAEMTVIENLQREDLNCMDQARAYVMLSQNFGLTQEQIGQRLGTSRESVSNYMRLVKLPPLVQEYLQRGELDFSHARILLNLKEPDLTEQVAHKAANENWSVEKLEHFVIFDPSMAGVHREAPKARGARWVDPNVRAAQRELERILGVKVRIRDRKGKGKITLEYSTLEDFDRVLGMLKGKK